MSQEVRTFQIRTGTHTAEDQRTLSNFLANVKCTKLETAYADGAWQVFVLFEDLRRREEEAQILNLLKASLNGWRGKRAISLGIRPDQVLDDELLGEIARYVPTTEVELKALLSIRNLVMGSETHEILRIVKDTLDLLSDAA